MTKFKVLIEGYAKKIKGGWRAASSTTFIESKGKRIIVDPGINRKRLLKELEKQKLDVAKIDYVFMTHYHPDHNLLAGIFPNAKVLDDELMYANDYQTEHQKVIPGTDIEILSTPGHDLFHSSLVFPTDKGIVVVAGDVFWWADNEKRRTDKKSLLSRKDPFVKDKKALLQSRQKLLTIADWIIPGHGKIFKNQRR